MSGEAPESREGQPLNEPTAAVRPPRSGTTAAAVEPPPRVPGPSTASIWDRIKRHKVVEWTLAYVAFGYALLHGVQMLRETFEWPLLVPRLTVFVLLVGVPVAATLAWYHGHRAQHRISGVELSILIALLLVAGSVLWWASRMGSTHVASIAVTDATHFNPPLGDKSIAVLPFIDMSEKHDQEYFADGMAEEVLDLLAKIPGIIVIGRTSSFQFKGRNQDLRTIGAKLNVAHILEGSVRKSGDRVRVTAQLIDAHTGAHEWSNSYERDTSDILKLQDEIAAGLVRALEVTVGAGDLQPRGTLKNMAAYQFFLRGRHAYDRSDKAGYEEAAANFQNALELEPSFADAAGALAWTRTYQAFDGFIGYAEGFEDARRLAENAIRLDPTLAVGHAVLAIYYTCLAWNWTAADQQAKRALALQPHAVSSLLAASILAGTLGRWDETIRLLNAATKLDPLNAKLFWWIGNARYRSNRLPEAEAAFRRVLEISPAFNSAHFELGRVLLARGQLGEALKEVERESPDPSSGRTAGLALVYHALGRKADSDAALALLVKESPDWPFGIAQVRAFRGEMDQALKELDRAYSEKDELHLMKDDLLLKGLEKDPRYKAFLRKMNLPD
jgi:adenylate cyclase